MRVALTFSLLLLTGCGSAVLAPLAITAAGAGATTAIKYRFDGVTYRTFTAPASAVQKASLAALERMGLEPLTVASSEDGNVISARSASREVELELEVVSPRATRVRIAAKNGGLFYDSATASEIVLQTEKMLNAEATTVAAGATALASCLPTYRY